MCFKQSIFASLNYSGTFGRVMKKIILVDNHHLFREGMRLLIEDDETAEVIAEAENGKELSQLLKRHKPDLVIMDMETELINGWSTVKKITALYPELSILMLTSTNMHRSDTKEKEAGTMVFIEKSAGKKELEKVIRKILNKENSGKG